jgi:hypothetical protein
MNVADPMCSYLNLTEHITASDVQSIRSIFAIGLQKMVFQLEKLDSYFTSCPPAEPSEGDQSTQPDLSSNSPLFDPFDSFTFHCFKKTRQISLRHKNQVTTVQDLAFFEQLKKNACYRDNAIVSSPDILLKQGEFILMGIQVRSSIQSTLTLFRIQRDSFKSLRPPLRI